MHELTHNKISFEVQYSPYLCKWYSPKLALDITKIEFGRMSFWINQQQISEWWQEKKKKNKTTFMGF